MNRRPACSLALPLVALLSALVQLPVDAHTPTGPDLWVCDLTDTIKWGAADSVVAYSIASSRSNGGDETVAWVAETSQHPVTFQNIYRLHNGCMEQLGMSWGMHGFCALQLEACALGCSDPGGGCLAFLTPSCTTVNSAANTGSPTLNGPHRQINAWTGAFIFPQAMPDPDVPSLIRGRLQVHIAELLPEAQYFAEVWTVHPGDAQAGNHDNNASYRPVAVSPSPGLDLAFVGGTQSQRPALQAWQDHDSNIQKAAFDVPGEGRFLVYYKISNNQDGTWHYEYAVLNVNSDRSAREFSVAVPSGVNLTNIDFHDVDYHSGDGIGGVNFDDTDWQIDLEGERVRWSTDSFDANENANALRFSTTYNFRFDADTPPGPAEVGIGLFKPGIPEWVSRVLAGPGPSCVQDIDGDAMVGAGDLALLLGAWGAADSSADLNGDGEVDAADLALLIGSWGACRS